MKFTQRISGIGQLMTNNQHIHNALRSVIDRFNYDKMKELINTIVDVISKNATGDWSKRDDVIARLRITVKKILMRHGPTRFSNTGSRSCPYLRRSTDRNVYK